MREAVCPIGPAFLLLISLACPVLTAQDDVEVWRARYRRVEAELRAAGQPGLTPEQTRARAAALDDLADYWRAGSFGIDRRSVNGRAPLFVDGDGRRCAIAFLLDRSGETALVEQIARNHNDAWLVELADEPRLQGWLRRSGLTTVDAARIQGPGMDERMLSRMRRVVLQPPPPPPPRWAGPEDAAAPTRAGGSARPVGAPAPRAGRVTPTAMPVPIARGVPATELEAPEWELFWEGARDGFLVEAAAPGSSNASPREHARADLASRLVALLVHTDAHIRGAAAQALGNLREPSRALLIAVDDAQREVRMQAILALGGVQASVGADVLLRLVRLDAGQRDPLAPVALIALGLGGVVLDATVRRAVTEPGSDASVRLAALVQGELTGADWLEATAVADLHATDLALSCRAAEALGSVPSVQAVAALTRALSGPNRELRRSAAAGLGRSPHALALPALQTAYDLEREQVTRAALLLAIGRHREPDARAFLLAELSATQRALRCFAALGLGHAVRTLGSDGDAARTALRTAFVADHNHSAHGAYLIALGLARDTAALDLLAERLAHGTPALRLAAAEGLTLLGGDDAVRRLRARLRDEPCRVVRSAIADGLCVIGRESDVTAVADVLAAEAQTDAAAALATALGRRYTAVGLAALRALAFDAARPSTVRAAAVAGLGTMLREPPPRRLVELVREANWRAMPAWLSNLLAAAL